METVTNSDSTWIEGYRVKIENIKMWEKCNRGRLRGFIFVPLGATISFVGVQIFFFIKGYGPQEILNWSLPYVRQAVILSFAAYFLTPERRSFLKSLFQRFLGFVNNRYVRTIVYFLIIVNVTTVPLDRNFTMFLEDEVIALMVIFASCYCLHDFRRSRKALRHSQEVLEPRPVTVVSTKPFIADLLKFLIKFSQQKRYDYLPISREQSIALWNSIDQTVEYIRKMRLDPLPHFSVLLDRTSDESLPRVAQFNENGTFEFYLLIPRNFLKLFNTHQEQASAMIAHEISHIYQRDADLLVTDRFVDFFSWTVTPLIVNYLVCAMYFFHSANQGPELQLIGLLVFLLGLKIRSMRSIKTSELLADLFAANASSREALIAAICDRTGDRSPFHPARKKRIRALQGR